MERNENGFGEKSKQNVKLSVLSIETPKLETFLLLHLFTKNVNLWKDKQIPMIQYLIWIYYPGGQWWKKRRFPFFIYSSFSRWALVSHSLVFNLMNRGYSSFSLSLTHTHTFTHTLSLSLSRAHTYTLHTLSHKHTPSLSCTHIYTNSLSISLAHTHTHTHTDTQAHTHIHTHTFTFSLSLIFSLPPLPCSNIIVG